MAKVTSRNCVKLAQAKTPITLNYEDERSVNEYWTLYTLRSDGAILRKTAFKHTYKENASQPSFFRDPPYTTYSSNPIVGTFKQEVVSDRTRLMAAFERYCAKRGAVIK